jgi:xanthine dehydrogenase accessory factor
MASGSELAAILRLARSCRREGVRAGLAHLVAVEGSHYRRAGARMLLAESGRCAGAISAGCLEADLRLRLAGVLSSGSAEVLEYDSRSFEDLAWGLGTGCNGKVRVLLVPVTDDLFAVLEAAEASLAEGRPARIETVVDPPPGSGRPRGEARLLEELPPRPEPGVVVEEIPPPIALLIAGAGPDAVPLARLARELGWSVAVLSRRDRAFLEDRFAGIEAVFPGGAEAVPALPVHARSAAVVMSHSFTEDTETLRALIERGFPYLGVLGPRERTGRLLAACSPRPEAAPRIQSPVGMDLGAETAEEIALAIAAEILNALSRPPSESPAPPE